jgi:integrase
VLNAAKAKGYRTGENPAAWKGHLDQILPRRQKLARGHHSALPYRELPDFLKELCERQAMAALALESTILTAVRSGEVLGATWQEIDIERAVWIVPAHRMKAGREHRVPLSPRALSILEAVKPLANGAGSFIFPGKSGKPLSGMSMAMLLRRMGRGEITVHGFRSTFRDRAAEATAFPRDIAEAALAHSIGDQTERAYLRSDILEKRRELMIAWGRFCLASGDNVVSLRRNA